MTISICVKIGNMISNLHKSFTNWLQNNYIKICPKCGKNLIISYPITTCTNKYCCNRINIENEPHFFDLHAPKYKKSVRDP